MALTPSDNDAERYATLAVTGDGTLTVWEIDEAGRHRAVARSVAPEDVPGLAVWQFELSTSDMVRSEANQANHPVLDADGAPLWPGARVSYRQVFRHIQVHTGEADLNKFDRYAGVTIVADNPLPRQISRDHWGPPDRNHYCTVAEYRTDGDLKGALVLSRKVGDPHKYGEYETWIRLADDPRNVCRLVLEPDSRPVRTPAI